MKHRPRRNAAWRRSTWILRHIKDSFSRNESHLAVAVVIIIIVSGSIRWSAADFYFVHRHETSTR